MTTYIILYLFILVCSFADVTNSSKEQKFKILALEVLILVLFRGFRWEVGTDWDQFETCFNLANWNNIFNYDRYGNGLETMEFGWMFLNVLIKEFGDYTLFLTITNFFLVSTWAVLSWKLIPQKPLMTFAMIVVSNLFFPIRLQIAAGIFCLTIYYHYKKKVPITILLYLITCSIHKSAIFLAPYFIVAAKRINYFIIAFFLLLMLISSKIAVFISLVVLGVAALIFPYLPSLANNLALYSNLEIAGAKEQSILSVVVSFLFATFIICMLVYTRKRIESNEKNKESEKRKINIFLNGYLFFTFAYKFFDIETLANFKRLAEYFTISFSIGFLISYLELRKVFSEKKLFCFYVLFYLYRLKGLLDTPFYDAMYPYKSIFN